MTFKLFGRSDYKLPTKTPPSYVLSDLEDKKYPKGSVVAVIDADTIIFPICTKADNRHGLVEHNGEILRFDGVRKFQGWCKSNSLNEEDFEYVHNVDPEPIENCLSTIRRAIKNAKDAVGATHLEVYVSGKGNHRFDLDLPNKYKDSRDPYRPTYLKQSQDYVLNYQGGKRFDGIETDDIVSIRSLQINKQDGVKSVLITSDKDALQSYTSENFVYRGGVMYHCDSVIGELWLDNGGKVKGKGLKWLLTQALITGDSTDGYLPRFFFKKTYGEKSWYKDVVHIDDIKTLLEFSVSKFKELLGVKTLKDKIGYNSWTTLYVEKSWLEIAEMYWSCAFMLVDTHKNPTFEDILKEYGVDYVV